IEAYNNLTDLTIDGQKDYASGKTISYTVQNEASNVDIVFASEGSYYRYVQVVLPYIAPAAGGTEYENEEASVIWPFNSDNYAGNYTATPAGDFGFQLVTVAIEGGSYVGTSTCSEMDGKSNGVTFVKVQPEATGVNTVWTVKPAAGLTFTPTKVSLHLCKFGTDAGKVAYPLMAKTEDGASVNLGSYVPCRNNKVGTGDASYNETNWTSYIEVELTAEQQAQLATTGAFSISMNMDNLANNKQGGFSDVRIYGLLNGKIQEVSKYAVTVAAEPAEGGSVSIYPNVAEFNEGSEVKVTATENFGYNFVNWTDADGNEVSVEPVFTLAVDKAYDLTANFVAVETYELAYAVEGGANLYMVNPTPAPTVVEGKNMYEDGTTVSLVASSNPILTFTNWSDGQTSGEISLIMSQDYSYTASYTAADYIVGWDFYLAGGSGRPADFAAADNDAVSLVLRTDDGQTSGWLDKSQMAAGGYEGRPGAVNWRTGSAEGDVGHYYFQTKFNASAFTNVVMQTSSVYNFNSYTNFFIQYSLDGENWTTIGNLAMQGAKSWCDTTVEFPEECNNKAEVYVRWYPDRDSAIDGTASANDGFCLGATYVTGTPQLVDDGTAPVLVTTVPAEGADNASASGKVVLTFDEKVKVAEGTTATLGELSLKPFVSGKVVTFEYKGLDYVTDYTFTLKAGSVMDLTDNAIEEDIVINFTTKNRPEIAKGAYDFIVPDDGNFREAINAANSRADKSARYRIFVRQGAHVSPAEGEMAGTGSYEGNTYPDPRLDLTTNNVSIIGEGLEVTSVVNECPDAATGTTNPIEGLRHAYTLHNLGTGTYIEDIKLINDLSDATGRGEAYEESGDKTILKGVGLWGYQDTYCSNNGSGRYYVEGGVIRGRTDYICGKDDIFFNGVEFRNVGKGGYIAVPSSPRQYGWILRDCRVTAENPDETNGTFTLGRPWGNGTPIALWINTVCEVLPSAAGWAEMSGGWPARFAEYNTTTATGTTVDLSDRKTTFGDGHVNNPILTADEAAFYTVQNVLGGDDDWDPTAATEDAPGPDRVDLSEAGVMTWEDSPYVLLWAICKDGVVIDFTIEPTYTVDDLDAKYSVRPANEMGGLGEPVEAQKTVGIINVETGAEVISTVTYNMQGQRVANNYRGASLRVETLSDGTVRTVKSME
ncbi:MAG: Ig-like domain-containing protein, partial [Muribaculaceae bacterium]|nr:Ig-like domain-containing protein [Muribaculaceae bacterium]